MTQPKDTARWRSVRIKDATPEQLKQATCTECGELVTKRGWITIYPEWFGRPVHGRCL